MTNPKKTARAGRPYRNGLLSGLIRKADNAINVRHPPAISASVLARIRPVMLARPATGWVMKVERVQVFHAACVKNSIFRPVDSSCSAASNADGPPARLASRNQKFPRVQNSSLAARAGRPHGKSFVIRHAVQQPDAKVKEQRIGHALNAMLHGWERWLVTISNAQCVTK